VEETNKKEEKKGGGEGGGRGGGGDRGCVFCCGIILNCPLFMGEVMTLDRGGGD